MTDSLVAHSEPTKRIFWTENASRPVSSSGGEIFFTRAGGFGGGPLRGYYVTEDISEIMALLAHCAINGACKEIAAKEFEEKVGIRVKEAIYVDVVPPPNSDASREKAEYRSFLDQTTWDCGLFTFPTALGLAVNFNCSIAEYNGQKFLFTRRHRFNTNPAVKGSNQSDLEIYRIRPNMTLTGGIVPAIPGRYPNEQWEDPRAIVGSDGNCYVSFATWVHGKNWKIRQSFCRLLPDWNRFAVVSEPTFGGNSPIPANCRHHEKNWAWFEYAKKWHFVYTINPHVVVREETCDKPYIGRRMELPWKWGEIRGGTPPVRISGKEYLCFFHSAIPWRPPKRRYFMGAYTFSALPPFEIRRITPEPLLVGSEEDWRTLGSPLVIFPNGALLERNPDRWLVVFGVNDENCGWIRIPDDQLQKKLILVKSK